MPCSTKQQGARTPCFPPSPGSGVGKSARPAPSVLHTKQAQSTPLSLQSPIHKASAHFAAALPLPPGPAAGPIAVPAGGWGGMRPLAWLLCGAVLGLTHLAVLRRPAEPATVAAQGRSAGYGSQGLSQGCGGLRLVWLTSQPPALAPTRWGPPWLKCWRGDGAPPSGGRHTPAGGVRRAKKRGMFINCD